MQLLCPLGTPGPELCRELWMQLGRMPERMPDGMSEYVRICQNMSEYIPERMPNRMSEYMSDKMPDIMSEYMSERMSVGGDHLKKMIL